MNTSKIRRLLERATVTAGQGLVEYALILALIAIVVIVALQFIGTGVNSTLSKVGQSI